MKNKKADALAIELMDDLLDEDQVQSDEALETEEYDSGADSLKSEESHLRDVSEASSIELGSVNDLKEMDVTHFVDEVRSVEDSEPLERDEELVFGSGEEVLPDPSELKTLKNNEGFIPQEESGPTEEGIDDRTVKLGASEIASIPFKPEAETPVSSGDETYVAHRKDIDTKAGNHEPSIRAGVGKFAVRGVGLGGGELQLAQSENLRIAQHKIIDLEKEIERLRKDNENLAAAGETFKNSLDELQSQLEINENELRSTKEILEGEKSLLLENLSRKEKEGKESKQRLEELEMRLSSNIQKIRVRERELENRLELVKMENAALLRSKDELILDLKRHMDQLNQELDNYRAKGKELNKQLSDKQDMLRRTVKALRLSLTMLEGDNHSVDKKKAE